MSQILSWQGTAGRGSYAAAFVCFCALSAVWVISPKLGLLRGVLAPCIALVLLWAVAQTRRRLRDAGMSGYWMWGCLAPGLSLILPIVLMLRRSKPQPESAGAPAASWGARIGKIPFYVFAVLLASRALWAPFTIPSGSMKPTLLVGDTLSVVPFTRAPERGDVVVFSSSVTGFDYIIRIVGLPGDTVQMREGQLYLNHVLVEQAQEGVFAEVMQPQGAMQLMPRCANGVVGLGEICEKTQMRETLPGGRSYAVLDIGHQAGDTTAPYTVPDGHYFMLSDNRDNAIDSRMPVVARGFGFVAKEALIGRADRVLFSERDMGYSAEGSSLWPWRMDRFFKEIE